MSRRSPMSHRIFTCDSREIVFCCDPAINIPDTIFSFLDDDVGQESSESSSDDGVYVDDEYEDENEEKDNSVNVEDNQFWETQHQLLQVVLCRTTPLESQVRSITKEIVKEARQSENGCACRKMSKDGCRSCLMKEVSSRLLNSGFNSAICKSKWKSSPDIPSGAHTFIDVVDSSNPKRGEIRVIVELNLRGEFEMARASEEYNRLIKCLPEVFVGKIERLLSIIKILCTCAKRCMKEKKMHMGPWRKQKYMQAKWLKTRERMTVKPSLSATGYSTRPPRPSASMLTADFLENFPNLHLTAVEVV